MAVPSVPTFSVAAKAAANTELLALLDAGSAGGSIRLRDADDVLLAEVPLSLPGGTVNETTGALELSVAGPDSSADAGGTVAYAELCDYDGDVHLALPAKQGTEAEDGYLVLNNLAVLQGGTVTITSATIG